MLFDSIHLTDLQCHAAAMSRFEAFSLSITTLRLAEHSRLSELIRNGSRFLLTGYSTETYRHEPPLPELMESHNTQRYWESERASRVFVALPSALQAPPLSELERINVWRSLGIKEKSYRLSTSNKRLDFLQLIGDGQSSLLYPFIAPVYIGSRSLEVSKERVRLSWAQGACRPTVAE